MIKTLSVLTLGAILALGACKPPDNYDKGSVLYEATGPSYLLLGDAGCSGVHIGGGKVLTANHCPAPSGKRDKVLWRSGYRDVMLVLMPGEDYREPVSLACREPIIGEKITAITFPGFPERIGPGVTKMRRLGAIHTQGYVAGKGEDFGPWSKFLLGNVTAAPGSSGGPVYTEDGKLLGLVVGGHTPFGNMAFIVPSIAICQLLNMGTNDAAE